MTGISRRLLVSFGALVLLFSGATYLAIAGMADIHHLVHHAQENEANVRSVLEVAGTIRELSQHASEAVVLPDDPAPRARYDQALASMRTTLGALRKHASSPEQAAALDELEAAARRAEERFRDRLVPSLTARTASTELVALRQHHETLLGGAQRLRERFQKAAGRFDDHAAATEHATFRWMLFALIGATLFAIGVALYIGRSVARPIARLEAGAARVAQGDLDTRIELHARDEFGRLADRFNAMTAALKAHQEKLVQSEKLAGIGRLAAGVAHEINNPLGVIIGYVRLLEQKAEGALAEDLKVIADEALRCQEIVDGLLELSRPARTESVPCALREICDEVVARMREANQLGEVRVEIEGDGVVTGHPQKLRQILFNLIKNAVEAAGARGTVRVRVDSGPTGASVTVADSGPGVPLSLQTRLFEPFFTTKSTGTGLGLAVSQAIAQAHGGSIELDSGAGTGATFKLRLPA